MNPAKPCSRALRTQLPTSPGIRLVEKSRRGKARAGVAALAGLLSLVATPAFAFDYNLKVEPGVAFPITSPQKDRFGVGGAVALKAGIGFWGVLDLQLAGHFVGLTDTGATTSGIGEAWGVGGGLRLKLPHRISIVSPWIDADVLYIRTGPLDRLGYTVGAGLSFKLDKAKIVWLGPFVRYMQIIQPDHVGTLNEDAKIIIAGLSLEIGSSTHKAAAPVVVAGPSDRDHDGVLDADDRCPDAAGPKETQGCPDHDGDGIVDIDDKCPDAAGPKETQGCPDRDGDMVADVDDKCPDVPGPKENQGCPLDRDHDGVIDSEDACPDVAGPAKFHGCPDTDGDGVVYPNDYCPDVPGPADNFGCPKYKKVNVTQGKLEITEKVYFANDSAKILPRSFPVLDEVTHALRDAKALRVRVEGHTDSNGKLEHNQVLSENRAKSVMDYLIKKGIAGERLESHGYGPSQPLETNKTVDGREHNRRVEFVIIKEGTAK